MISYRFLNFLDFTFETPNSLLLNHLLSFGIYYSKHSIMKKTILLIVVLLFTVSFYGQVGINTTDPNATLDVEATSVTSPTNEDGMLIPRIDDFPSSNQGAAQDGMMVFVTGNGTPSKGFYYWDNGTTTWVSVNGAGGGTLDQAYDQGGAGLGRTVIADSGAVLIGGDDGLQNTGTFGSGATLALSGGGTKMFFYPRKAAFRAGNVTATQWNDANIGDYSVAMGRSTTASGIYDVAIGFGAIASGTYSTALGYANTATGPYSMSLGQDSDATGWSSTVLGRSSAASGSQSMVFGHNTNISGTRAIGIGNYLESPSGYEIALGNYNTTYTPNSTAGIDASDRLLSVGNGTSPAARSNALTIYKSGLININDAYNLPLADGTNGQVMTTDGAGNISFTTVSSTDDQTIDTFSFNSGTNLVSLEIEDDGIGVQTVDLSALDDEDADWLTTVGSNIPTSNTEDIFTFGNVSIGSTANFANFNIDHNEAADGTIDYLQYNAVSNSGNDDKTIIYNSFGSAQAGNNTAMYNLMIGNGSGTYRGVHNYSYASVTGDIFGVYNVFSANGNGAHYGSRTSLSGIGSGLKYGTYNYISPTAGGTHYGIYADVQNAGGYAGYFLGRTSLGNSTTNRYLMPAADGTAGQVMTTDGAGNISFQTPTISNDDQTIDTFSFNNSTNTLTLEIENDGIGAQTVDLSSLDNEDADWYQVGTSSSPSNNTDDIFTDGRVGIGDTSPSSALEISETSSDLYAVNIDYTYTGTGSPARALWVQADGTGVGSTVYGAYIQAVNSNSSGSSTAVYAFNAATATNNTGLDGYATGSGTTNIGVLGRANDGATANYGGSFYANGTGATNYGIYSRAYGATTNWAGYFGDANANSGNVYIKDLLQLDGSLLYTDGNEAVGRVLTSDASGNASWADPSATDATSASNGLTEVGDDIQLGGTLTQNTTITNGNFDIEITSTGTATDALTITKTDNSASNNTALDINKTTNGTGSGAGIALTMSGTGSGAVFGYDASISSTGTATKYAFSNYFSGTGTGTNYGLRNQFFGTGSGTKYAVYNSFGTSSISAKFGLYNDFDSSSGNYYGVNNNMVGATNSAVFGITNTLAGTGTGAKTGVSNSFSGANGNVNIYIGTDNSFSDTGNGNRWGTRNNMDGSGTGIHYGAFNDLTGTGSGNKYGSYNYIDSGAGGTHYGVYSDVDNSNGYAGYFLGQNYVSQAIGINNLNPDGRLDIIHNSTGFASPHVMLTAQNANSGTRITFDNAVETNNYWVMFARADDTSGSGTFNIYSSEVATNVMRLESDGKMGIMRNPTTNTLEVEGEASKTTAGAFVANSDKRLKKDIETITGETALSKIEKMRGVTYLWDDDKTGSKRPDGLQYGFIAQELMEVFPEKVTKDNLGFYQTAYGDYDPIFVEAIKELKTKNEKLQEKVKSLETQLSKYEELEARLSALESKKSESNSDGFISEEKK